MLFSLNAAAGLLLEDTPPSYALSNSMPPTSASLFRSSQATQGEAATGTMRLVRHAARKRRGRATTPPKFGGSSASPEEACEPNPDHGMIVNVLADTSTPCKLEVTAVVDAGSVDAGSNGLSLKLLYRSADGG